MINSDQTPNLSDSKFIIFVSIFFTLLAISAPWFDLSVSSHDLVKSYSVNFGAGLLILFLFALKCNNSIVNLKVNYIKLTLLLLFLYGAVSAVWSINLDFTITKWLLWLGAAFGFLLGLNLSTNSQAIVKIVWGLVISAGVISIIGITQHLFDPYSLAQAAPPASTFGNKNMATQPLVLILPLTFFLFLFDDTRGVKSWFITTLIALIIVFIVYTSTRAAWLSIFIESTLIAGYLLIKRKTIIEWVNWDRNKRNASIFGVLLVLILINFSSEGLINFTEIGSDNIASFAQSAMNTDSARYQIWQIAFKIIQDSPFIGTGLGTFSQNLVNEGYATWFINNTIRSHNDIFELAVELGLIGISIFVLVIVSIFWAVVKILQNSKNEVNFFYFILFVALSGSFINMQFSFPYQMAVPLLIFGLYCGLIAKQIDRYVEPIKIISFRPKSIHKKILLTFSGIILITGFYFTYFNWIKAYSELNKINLSGNFQKIDLVETPIYHGGMQYMLYKMAGNYFNKGHYQQSQQIDKQILKRWPNHLDVLFRFAYATHKLEFNKTALQLANKLKKLEPKGLYNGYIVEMYIHSSSKNKTKFLATFNELLNLPEEVLSLNSNTYRFLIFFTLESKELAKLAPTLYDKYIKYHGYSCEVENNIAIHYFNSSQFEKSASHVLKAFEKGSDCLNIQLVALLVEKKLVKTLKWQQSK